MKGFGKYDSESEILELSDKQIREADTELEVLKIIARLLVIKMFD